MRIAAYIALQRCMMEENLRGMPDENFFISTACIQKILHDIHVKRGNLREIFAKFWERVFSSAKYDLLFSYHLPDEITIEKCKKYNVNILIQEFFGRCPDKLPSVLPLYCDYRKAYGEGKDPVKISPPVEKPLITVLLEEMIFPKLESIEGMLASDTLGKCFLSRKIFWNNDPLLESRMKFIQAVINIVKSSKDLSSCRLMFRPKLAFIKNFAEEIQFIQSLKDPDIDIDLNPVEETLAKQDLVICTHSNFGVDSIRAGAELIIYGAKAFYSNPQLAHIAETPAELETALKKAVADLRSRGKQLKSFMPGLLKDIREPGPLSYKYEPPYEPERVKNAIKYAAGLPLIENWARL